SAVPLPRSPPSTLFPSTPLFRSLSEAEHVGAREPRAALERVPREPARFGFYSIPAHRAAGDEFPVQPIVLDQVLEDSVKEWNVPDRKSTRLNSSHLGISYAVFCL